ncbi:hypothetical protein D3C73_1654270 [compost metagenome]
MADLHPDLDGGAGAGVRGVQAFGAAAQALTDAQDHCWKIIVGASLLAMAVGLSKHC